MNANIARELLDGGSFLVNGLDEDVRCEPTSFGDSAITRLQGRTNNLAHPALGGLVVDFFYTGANALTIQFPEVFATEVPRPTVALAATAVSRDLPIFTKLI